MKRACCVGTLVLLLSLATRAAGAEPTEALRSEDRIKTVPIGTPQKQSKVPGFLAQGTSLIGDLHFSGTLHINGNVRGSIFTADVLIIGEHATVEAVIKAGEVQIYGTVVGNIDGVRRIEICESGRLRGDVRTPKLVIKEGALFEGTSLAAVVSESIKPSEKIWAPGESRPDAAQLSTP